MTNKILGLMIVTVFAQASMAAELTVDIQLDTSRSLVNHCRKFNELTLWGGNVHVINNLNTREVIQNLMYAGQEPIPDFNAPPEMFGNFRFGGNRGGENLWFAPSKENPEVIDTVYIPTRIGPPPTRFCVYMSAQPIPREMFR